MRSERFDHWFDRDTQTLVELDHRSHIAHDEIDLIEDRPSVRHSETPQRAENDSKHIAR